LLALAAIFVPSTLTVIWPNLASFNSWASCRTLTKLSFTSALFCARKVQIVSWSGWVSPVMSRTATLS